MNRSPVVCACDMAAVALDGIPCVLGAVVGFSLCFLLAFVLSFIGSFQVDNALGTVFGTELGPTVDGVVGTIVGSVLGSILGCLLATVVVTGDQTTCRPYSARWRSTGVARLLSLLVCVFPEQCREQKLEELCGDLIEIESRCGRMVYLLDLVFDLPRLAVAARERPSGR